MKPEYLHPHYPNEVIANKLKRTGLCGTRAVYELPGATGYLVCGATDDRIKKRFGPSQRLTAHDYAIRTSMVRG